MLLKNNASSISTQVEPSFSEVYLKLNVHDFQHTYKVLFAILAASSVASSDLEVCGGPLSIHFKYYLLICLVGVFVESLNLNLLSSVNYLSLVERRNWKENP